MQRGLLLPLKGRFWFSKTTPRVQVDCVSPDRPFGGFISLAETKI